MGISKKAGALIAVGLLLCTGSWASRARMLTGGASGVREKLSRIRLPQGFKIELFAVVPHARSMTMSPSGILYVGNRDGDSVYAVRPSGEVIIVASGLDTPNGVAFRDGALYVAEVSRILKFADVERKLGQPQKYSVLTDRFPTDTHHGWKFIAFGPDGKLYVPVGAPCNVCERSDPYAAITRMNPDGSAFEIFARGIRNTVGFDWHPVTHELWFTDNGRDLMGDELPPDELNRAPKGGMNFGFPYCHGGDIADPELGKKHPCAEFTPPVQKLPAHVASLGTRFYTGKTFPAEYRHQIFIAEHGSWNRSSPIGYRVTQVRLDGNRAVSYQPFAEGWLEGSVAWGRPVDVQVAPNGDLFVSDDYNGVIYRIRYEKAGK